MKVRDFPFCCNAKILCDLGSSEYSEGYEEDEELGNIKSFIEDCIVGYQSGIKKYTLFTTLNSEQWKRFGHFFTEQGFKCVSINESFHEGYVFYLCKSYKTGGMLKKTISQYS